MGDCTETSILFTQLDAYIGEPVWDRNMNRWRVLIGYRRYENNREVMFTDSKSMEVWESVDLTTIKEEKQEKTKRPEW